ncbi:hypothetical protein PINS_up016092 [Pythium insidiosum]|nr:hypothetical protein PINS_up016092 [Pythium insidiosum]
MSHKFHKKSHKKHVKADENNPPDVEDPEVKSHKKTHKNEKTEFPHGIVEISNGESGGDSSFGFNCNHDSIMYASTRIGNTKHSTLEKRHIKRDTPEGPPRPAVVLTPREMLIS